MNLNTYKDTWLEINSLKYTQHPQLAGHVQLSHITATCHHQIATINEERLTILSVGEDIGGKTFTQYKIMPNSESFKEG